MSKHGDAKTPDLNSFTRPILGQSPAIKALIEMIRKVAAAKTNILIIGESGTGKELVARMIHEAGPLRDKPFIPVNCGAIPENLIESEMFGHKRGSFTGAVADKTGLFEAANGGTLFLDEVGELPVGLQVKLLRALQEKTIRKVGGNEDIRVDARVIAATNRDLEAAITKGTFREDLYYRLNVIQIKTPPLRERKGDVRLLAEHFMREFARKQGKPVQGFEPEVMATLEAYAWPGNVRELENSIERVVTLETHERVTMGVLPHAIAEAAATAAASAALGPKPSGAPTGQIVLPAPDFTSGALDLDRILNDVERTYLTAALAHAGGIKKKAADLLGITFRSIRYRLAKLGVATQDDGAEEEEG